MGRAWTLSLPGEAGRLAGEGDARLGVMPARAGSAQDPVRAVVQDIAAQRRPVIEGGGGEVGGLALQKADRVARRCEDLFLALAPGGLAIPGRHTRPWSGGGAELPQGVPADGECVDAGRAGDLQRAGGRGGLAHGEPGGDRRSRTRVPSSRVTSRWQRRDHRWMPDPFRRLRRRSGALAGPFHQVEGDLHSIRFERSAACPELRRNYLDLRRSPRGSQIAL